MSGSRAPRTGRLARSAIAGVATARVGAAQARRRWASSDTPEAAAEHEARIGRILFTAMSRMRGTALKAAQVLSLDATFLPPGVRAELAKATHRVAPLNRALVGRAFRDAFGREPEALFATFEHPAFAAASLGQVHRATLADGTPLAVKVQYPGIAATIDSDLRLLRSALGNIGSGLPALPDPRIVERVLAEIERQLHEEVDYRHEAEQQRRFRARARHPDIVIPKAIASRTTRTVLTQQLLPGRHLDEWLTTRPTQAIRDRQGQAVFDWFVQCAWIRRRIHADLHPGNFVFRDDGRVGVLDFGCTLALSESFTSGLARAWCAWLDEPASNAALIDAYGGLGLVDPALEPSTFDAEVRPGIAPLLRWATEPFTRATFDFSRKSPLPAHDTSAQRFVVRHMAGVPPELPSFDRAWLGLMHLLHRLGAVIDTRAGRALLTSSGERRRAVATNPSPAAEGTR